MKKILFSIGILCLIAMTMISCNKGKEVAKIDLNSDLEYVVDVYGGEDDFFEPVAGIYPVIEKDGKWTVTIEFEKSKNTTSTNYTAEEFILIPLDKDEDYIEVNDNDVEFQAENKQNVTRELLNARVGDHVKVTFSYTPANDEIKTMLAEKIFTCEVELDLDEDETVSSSSSYAYSDESDDYGDIDDDDFDYDDGDDDDDDDDDSYSSSSSSSNNWDQILDDYESYVNQYVAFMKKANNGDMSALSEYPKMMDKAQSLSNKLQNASNEMTSAQMARYRRITSKMSQAAY